MGNSWQTSSGLLDDFDFKAEEAWFDTHPKMGDSLLLHLRGEAYEEGELVDDEHLLLFSCGDGWKAGKGGQIATHPAGKDTFSNSSNIGKLIDALVGLGPDVVEELSSRGESYEAETWQGINMHIVRKTFSFKDRQTGEERTYEVPLPTEFHGFGEAEEEEEKPKKGKAKGKGKKAPAKGKAKGKSKAKKGNGLRDAVIEFASEYDDHGEFVADVFDEEIFDRAEELTEDEELSAEVLDEDSELWDAAQS